MLIFFVFVKLLSLMTNTRERQSYPAKRQAGGCGDSRPRQPAGHRLWYFYREYVGRGCVNVGDDTHIVPCTFLRTTDSRPCKFPSDLGG